MFTPPIGRRATALATTLAVVVGLAITPAFTATATEGDEPVTAPQSTEVLPETVPQADPPVALPPADTPAEELPVDDVAPVDEATPPTDPGLMRSNAATQSSSPAGISPASIPTQVLLQPVDIQFSTTAPHNYWSVSLLWNPLSGTTISADGKLTGAFLVPGSHTMRVEAVKQVGKAAPKVVASQDYTFDVIPAVTTTSLPDATVGIGYNQTLDATRSLFPFFTNTFSITEGSLPPGISLNGVSGELSGTVMSIPDSPTTYNFSVKFSAFVFLYGPAESAPQPLSITVGYAAPDVTTTTLPDATVGSEYAGPALAADGDGTITWSATGLPDGLELDPITGIISGSPDYNSAFGTSTTVPVTVTANNGRDSAPQALTIVVNTPAPLFGAKRLPAATVGVLYDQVLPLSYAYGDLEYKLVQASVLPAGLELTADGRIYGTPEYDPTAGASKTITVAVRVDGTAGWDRKAFTFDLLTPAKPVLFNKAPAKVETGTLYTFKPDFDGESVTLSLGADAPADMTMNQNGRIFWTPSTAGNYEFTVKATNPAGTDRQKFTVKVFDAPVLTQGELAQGVINMPYRQQLQHDGTKVQFLVVDGELPDGMKLTRTGVLKGAAVEAGTFHFKVRAMNAVGVDRAWFTLTVLEPAMQLSAGNIIRGGSVTVSGSGYLPGDTLEFWLHSTPVLLGTVTATNGSFTSTVVIPADTPAGPHHFEVLGAHSGSQSVPFTVALPPAAAPAAPQSTRSQSSQLTVTPADEATTASDAEQIEEQSPAEEEADELPTLNNPVAEGETTAVVPANWTGMIAVAFVLLLAALLVWYLLWRRRRAA